MNKDEWKASAKLKSIRTIANGIRSLREIIGVEPLPYCYEQLSRNFEDAVFGRGYLLGHS